MLPHSRQKTKYSLELTSSYHSHALLTKARVVAAVAGAVVLLEAVVEVAAAHLLVEVAAGDLHSAVALVVVVVALLDAAQVDLVAEEVVPEVLGVVEGRK